MIHILEFIADHIGVVLGGLFIVILAAAVIRVAVKMHRGDPVEITPVGVMNDLPDSVTGINKYSDALDSEGNRKE